MLRPAKGKEERYWVTLIYGGPGVGERQLLEVPKAYRVSIEGFEHLDLFAARVSWYETGVKMGSWRVCEGTTGVAIGAGARTRAEAVQNAKKLLTLHGRKWTDEALENLVEEYGLTPRYTA
jgi:hypothetical protein